MKLPKVWGERFTDYIPNILKNEAAKYFRIHQLPENLKEWKKTRKKLRDEIWNSFGVSVNHDLKLDYRETGVIRMDGYCVKKVYYQSRSGFYVTGNLYVPEGKGPFPGVLGVHGHWQQGRLAERVQSRGHTLAKNGYVCLTVDAFGAGERSTTHGVYEYHGVTLGSSLLNIGEAPMGIQVVDNMRGIDLLCSLDFVNSSKIGVTGASGGGNQTMWVAAMDDRVKAAMPVVSVGSFESYVTRNNCICEVLPDGLTYTEESGILALVAPKALKICNCLGDTNPTFFPSEMLRSYTEARKVFQLYNTDEKLAYQIFNLPHGFWPEIREAMLGWFDLHLKGIGKGYPRTEIPFECLPEKDVMVFKKGKRSSKVLSTADYCRKKGTKLRSAFLGKKGFNATDERQKLKEILRIDHFLKIKSAHQYSPAEEWERVALETECGRIVPLLIRKPSGKCSEFIIIAAPEDKEELLNTKILSEAIKSGKGVVIPDLWGAGETATHTIEIYHELSRSVLWLGRTLLGEWVKDYSLIASFIEKEFNPLDIILSGYKEAGLAALFSSILGDQSYPVVLEKGPVSFLFNKESPPTFFTMAFLLPGIMNWGDVSLAVSLVNNKVRFIDPVMSDGIPLNKTELQRFTKEFKDIREKTGVPGKSVLK